MGIGGISIETVDGIVNVASGAALVGAIGQKLSDSNCFVFAAPLAIGTMAYTAVRASERLVERAFSGTWADPETWTDLMMLGGAACGVVATLGMLNPLLRAGATLVGAGLDGVDLARVGWRWWGEQVKTQDLLLQTALTLVFGIDKDSRKAVAGLFQPARQPPQFSKPLISIYSNAALIPAGTTDARSIGSIFASERLLSSGWVDLRDLRFWHTLSEGEASRLVAQKVRKMETILRQWQRKHPRGWLVHQDAIMDELTRGDKHSKSDRIRVVHCQGEDRLLLGNGHRRIAALCVLAARGEIPSQWLTRIPVWQSELWDPATLPRVTAGVDLNTTEVLGEVEVGGYSPAEVMALLAQTSRSRREIAPFKIPDEYDIEAAVELERFIARGDRVPPETEAYIIEAIIHAKVSEAVIYGDRLSRSSRLRGLVWEKAGDSPDRMAGFLESLYDADHNKENKVTPYLARVLVDHERLSGEFLDRIKYCRALANPILFNAIEAGSRAADPEIRAGFVDLSLYLPVERCYRSYERLIVAEQESRVLEVMRKRFSYSLYQLHNFVKNHGVEALFDRDRCTPLMRHRYEFESMECFDQSTDFSVNWSDVALWQRLGEIVQSAKMSEEHPLRLTPQQADELGQQIATAIASRRNIFP